jgi:hypothetical protein
MGEASKARRFQINPGPLKVIPAAKRKAWQSLAQDVELDIPGKFRRKWTRADTARVVLAEPDESYDDLGKELSRSPGAIRYRRMAMIALIRDEHGAQERVDSYRKDPAAHHKHHDYHQVDELLTELGIYDLPVSQQFEIAQPLQQPRASWRGDGLGAAVGGQEGIAALRREFRQVVQEARDERDAQTA